MEVYERINVLLKEKNMKKRDLAQAITRANFQLKSTGDAPSEKALYAYLSGKNSLRVELLPAIAEALGVSICELYGVCERDRQRILEHILNNPTAQESKQILQHGTASAAHAAKEGINTYAYRAVMELLPFASEVFLKRLIDILESFRDATQRGLKELR